MARDVAWDALSSSLVSILLDASLLPECIGLPSDDATEDVADAVGGACVEPGPDVERCREEAACDWLLHEQPNPSPGPLN